MENRHPWQRGLVLAVVMSPLAFLLAPPIAPARGPDDPVKILRAEAERLERNHEWGAAALKYEELTRLDRNQAVFRERYQFCLHRYLQIVRLRDPSYQKDVLSLKYPQAIHLYEIVLYNLLHNTLDKEKVTPTALFRKGVEEFQFALQSLEFCNDHLGGQKPEQTRALRNVLQAHYAGRKTATYEEAVDTMREVVMKAANHFPNINPTTVVMEFLCGACLALDDYTVYLTPRQLRELCATLKGQQVGVGLRLAERDNKTVIAEVLPDSPAAEITPPLAVGDHIAAVGKKSTQGLAPEMVMDLLEGQAGSTVELVIASAAHGHRLIVLTRRPLFIPSVQCDISGNVGYLKISCFQETTLDEFDAGLAELLKKDCEALVLDLRGNPGGLLDVSIEIAKRFLQNGSIIVSTQHLDPKSSKTYRSDNLMALGMPLVLLVDGDTASAAEVLTGALKENGRAKVVGQTTFGKGCSQGLLKLPSEGELRFPAASANGGTGGIRITIARFFAPGGQSYSGHGVEPDVPAEADRQIYEAQRVARELIGLMID